jgi:hypothetical protein
VRVEGRSEERDFEKVLSREDVRSSYLGRKVSVIPTKLQFTILDSTRDAVARSQSKKCGLKYVISSFKRKRQGHETLPFSESVLIQMLVLKKSKSSGYSFGSRLLRFCNFNVPGCIYWCLIET